MASVVNAIFIRHGNTDYNAEGRLQGQTDTQLNAKGRKQAKLAYQFVASQNYPLKEIVSSDLKRASATAEALVKTDIGPPTPEYGHLKIRETASLRELDFGTGNGMLKKDLEAKWSSYDDIPGGEREVDFRKRVEQSVQTILTAHDDAKFHVTEQKSTTEAVTLCVVAHGGVIRNVLDMALHSEEHSHSMKHVASSMFAIGNGSVSWIRYTRVDAQSEWIGKFISTVDTDRPEKMNCHSCDLYDRIRMGPCTVFANEYVRLVLNQSDQSWLFRCLLIPQLHIPPHEKMASPSHAKATTLCMQYQDLIMTALSKFGVTNVNIMAIGNLTRDADGHLPQDPSWYHTHWHILPRYGSGMVTRPYGTFVDMTYGDALTIDPQHGHVKRPVDAELLAAIKCDFQLALWDTGKFTLQEMLCTDPCDVVRIHIQENTMT